MYPYNLFRLAVGSGADNLKWTTYENQRDFGATFSELETVYLNSKVKSQKMTKRIAKAKDKKKNEAYRRGD